MKHSKVVFIVLSILVVVLITITPVFAVSTEGDNQGESSYGEYGNYVDEGYDDYEEDLDNYDFKKINDSLKSENIDFENMVKRLAKGDSKGIFYELLMAVFNKFTYDLVYNKTTIIKIIVIAVVSSLFTNMSLVLKKSDMGETGFYVTYILMITILAGGFGVIVEMVRDFSNNIIIFMNALIPTFLLSLTAMGFNTSAVAFGSLILTGIALIEKLIVNLVLPAINIYVILKLLNNIAEEDYLTKFAELVKTVVLWIIKGIMGFVIGGGVVQGIMLPTVDLGKKNIFTKIINILPGGDALTGVESIIATTGNVIKNAIGSAGLIAIAVLCLFPIIKMLIYIFIYKFLNAVVWPIADKRLSMGIDAVSEGVNMLYKTTLAMGLMLFISVAVACFSTGVR